MITKKVKKSGPNKSSVMMLADVGRWLKQGETVSVKPGFFRNFLHPRGFATRVTPGILAKQEVLRQERAEKSKQDKVDSEKIAAIINGAEIKFIRQANQQKAMFGSVTQKDLENQINELLAEKHEKLKISSDCIAMHKPFKTFGNQTVRIDLKEHDSITLNFRIDPEVQFIQELEEKSVADVAARAAHEKASAEKAAAASKEESSEEKPRRDDKDKPRRKN